MKQLNVDTAMCMHVENCSCEHGKLNLFIGTGQIKNCSCKQGKMMSYTNSTELILFCDFGIKLFV